jgi:Chaperonin 10 Kd subunit
MTKKTIVKDLHPYKLLVEVVNLKSILTTEVKQEKGIVLAVGEALTERFKVGDKILFKTWATDIFLIEEGEFCFVGIDVNDPLSAYCGKL